MNRLFAMSPLEDSFSCNFNLLIAGVPQVLGVRRILEEWIAFRTECVRRRVYFDLQKAKDKLHLLRGLEKILLDIDKAIRIVRGTDEEAEVVPNLMIGFGIDEIQAEYVAEIKLRHLNREYILKRTEEIDKLRQAIEEMEAVPPALRRRYRGGRRRRGGGDPRLSLHPLLHRRGLLQENHPRLPAYERGA